MAVHIPPPPSLFAGHILRQAMIESLKKLDPRLLWRYPVMFAVEIASTITLITFCISLSGNREPILLSNPNARAPSSVAMRRA